MYEFYCELSQGNFLAGDGKKLFVLRRINAGDVPVFRKIATLNNIYLARVYEITVINGDVYAVTEFIQGENLSEYISSNGVFTTEAAAKAMNAVCSGAAALHSAGIVHRDIKPSNIIITRDGTPVLTDFGICRIGTGRKTSDTAILGTAGYAAPEQFGFRETDCRADIYSLGIVLNYMLTGATPGEIHASGPLSSVVNRCTSMDPAARYPSADELMADIAARTGSPYTSQRATDKKKTASVAGMISYLAVVFFVCFALVAGNKDGGFPLSQLISFIVFLIAAPAMFFNPFRWQDRFPAGKLSHGTRRGIAIGIGVVIILASSAVIGVINSK